MKHLNAVFHDRSTPHQVQDLKLITIGANFVSLGLLTTLSAIGATFGTVLVCAAVFLAVSAMWALLELTGGPAVRAKASYVVGVVLTAIAVVAFVVGKVCALSPLLLSAFVAAAYGVGSLIGGYRLERHLSWKLSFGLLPAAVALGAGSALCIWRMADNSLGIALGALAAAALLAFANFVTECCLRQLEDDNAPTKSKTRLGAEGRVKTAVGGAVLTAAGVLLVGCFTNIGWQRLLIIAAVLVVLTFALVSNIHADLAIVTCVCVLLAVAPGEVTPPATVDFGRGSPQPLLALGDSYMSGEGAQRFYEGTDHAGARAVDDNQCRRASSAWSVQAGVGNPQFGGVTFLACSGARTYDVTATASLTPQEVRDHDNAQPEMTQVDQIRAIRTRHPEWQPKLVVVGLGGNDAGFAKIGAACIAPGDCSDRKTEFLGGLPAVEQALVRSFTSIGAALQPGTRIIVVPYPEPIYPDVAQCPELPTVVHEREFIVEFVKALNSRLEAAVTAAATSATIEFAGTMSTALADRGLQLCAPGKSESGIQSVRLATVNGVAVSRYDPTNWIHNSLHPNERGHDAILAAFNRYLSGHPTASAITKASPVAVVQTQASPRVTTVGWAGAQLVGSIVGILMAIVGIIGVWALCLSATAALRRRGFGGPVAPAEADDRVQNSRVEKPVPIVVPPQEPDSG